MHHPPRIRTVVPLGAAQTLACWAPTHCLPAVLAAPMARELGVAPAAVFAAFSMALAPGAWRLLGVDMGRGLYEATVAALVRLHGTQSRGGITGITPIAGFASTVGGPLSACLEAGWGWRGAGLAWAALHLLPGLPLNAARVGARRLEFGVLRQLHPLASVWLAPAPHPLGALALALSGGLGLAVFAALWWLRAPAQTGEGA